MVVGVPVESVVVVGDVVVDVGAAVVVRGRSPKCVVCQAVVVVPRHSQTPQKITHASKKSLMFLIHVLKRSISYETWSERTKFQ